MNNKEIKKFIEKEVKNQELKKTQKAVAEKNYVKGKKLLLNYYRKKQKINKKIKNVEPGARNIEKKINFPEDVFYHNGGRIIDITKAPFNAKGDGKVDNTDAIKSAYNFIAEKLRKHGWKNNKASYVLYFPEGEYLVSDTIQYDGERIKYKNYRWGGMIRLRIIGENKENTIIKLKDNSEGFDSKKPLLAFQKDYKGVGNNIPGTNVLENITINTGRNNPGAIAVEFIGANTSTIANINILSEDRQGYIGLNFPTWSVQGYYRDITIDGFDYGIHVEHYNETQPSFEYITLKNQNITGITISQGGPSIRKLLSKNEVSVLQINNKGANVVLVDSNLVGENRENIAMRKNEKKSNLFVRNTKVSGYKFSIIDANKNKVSGNIDQYVSDNNVYYFEEEEYKKSLNLVVAESPILYPESDLNEWANVDDFPGENDAERIQNAMNSGKSTIYFPDDEYGINSPVYVPASVKHIEFMFTNTKGKAEFIIDENNEKPLFFTNGHSRKSITQRSSRTIIMRNTGGRYKNENNEKAILFVENAANLGTSNNFCPSNQKIWARSVDNEDKNDTNFKIYGGLFWTLGFKTEGWREAFKIKNGGVLEVLGGYRNQTKKDMGFPLLSHSNDTMISFTGFTNLYSTYQEQIYKEPDNKINKDVLPVRSGGGFKSNNFIPLYVSYDLETLLSLIKIK